MSYPSSYDNIPTVTFGSLITSSYENSQTNAINAIETTLGLTPQGGAATVAAAISQCVQNTGFSKGDLLAATGSTVQRLPVGADGQVLTADSTQAAGVKWAAAGTSPSTIDNSLCNGRITLTSGAPVMTSDVVGATTVYFTPYQGGRIALYDGTSAWAVYSFSEASLALSALQTGGNYDLFGYLSGGVLALELSNPWTSDTARADALVVQDGVLVKSANKTRRYLGTFRTTGASTTEFSSAKKYVFNYYNRVEDCSLQGDTTPSWTQGTPDQYTAMDGGNASWKHEFVVGWVEDIVEAWAIVQCNGSGVRLGIGLDRTNGSDAVAVASGLGSSTTTLISVYRGRPGLGYHYFNGVQASYSGTATYYGLGPQPQLTVKMMR